MVPPPPNVEHVEACDSNNPSGEDENHLVEVPSVLVPDASSNVQAPLDDEMSVLAVIMDGPEDDASFVSGPRNELAVGNRAVVPNCGEKRPKDDDVGGARAVAEALHIYEVPQTPVVDQLEADTSKDPWNENENENNPLEVQAAPCV
ncbi:hypothetical protein R6Q59_017480 [Mikania micrantha]